MSTKEAAHCHLQDELVTSGFRLQSILRISAETEQN